MGVYIEISGKPDDTLVDQIEVNLSASIGNESLNRLACEIISAPNAAMTRKVSSSVMRIAIILLIFFSTKEVYNRVKYNCNNGCKNHRNNNVPCKVQHCQQNSYAD